jgi:hypothetical protein
VRLEELGKLKNPVTSSGIVPTNFRLEGQCHNQLGYAVSLTFTVPTDSGVMASALNLPRNVYWRLRSVEMSVKELLLHRDPDKFDTHT